MEEFEGRNKAEIYAKTAKIEELEDELRVKVAQYVKANTRLYDIDYQESQKEVLKMAVMNGENCKEVQTERSIV